MLSFGIAFYIIRFLQKKNVLLLTYNTDLIRLLQYQLDIIKKIHKESTYSDHNYNVAPNLLKQGFNVKAPKKDCVGGIKLDV